jgi:hypothetical protein
VREKFVWLTGEFIDFHQVVLDDMKLVNLKFNQKEKLEMNNFDKLGYLDMPKRGKT